MVVLEEVQTPLLHCGEHDNYLSYPRLKQMRHTNAMKQAIRFYAGELPLNSVLARVCYDGPWNIKELYPEWKNQMSNVSRLPQNEQVLQITLRTTSSKVCFVRSRRTCRERMASSASLHFLAASLWATVLVRFQCLRHAWFHHSTGDL